MGRCLRLLAAALVIGAAASVSPAAAQAKGSAEAALLRRRIVLLEDRVAILERQLEAMQEAMRVQQEAWAAQAAAPGPTYLRLDRSDGWRTRENWRLLRRGLNQIEVRYLLGAPGGVDVGDLFTEWYYPDPRGGRVRFDAFGGRLESWSEPW